MLKLISKFDAMRTTINQASVTKSFHTPAGNKTTLIKGTAINEMLIGLHLAQIRFADRGLAGLASGLIGFVRSSVTRIPNAGAA